MLPYSAVTHMHTCYKFIHICSHSHIKSLPHTSILIVPLTCSHIRTCSLFTDAIRYSRIHTDTDSSICTFIHSLNCMSLLTNLLIHWHDCICLCEHIHIFTYTHVFILLTNKTTLFCHTQIYSHFIRLVARSSMNIFTHTFGHKHTQSFIYMNMLTHSCTC